MSREAARPQELCSVCILVGGRGTRLGARVRDLPKPLIEVAGEPFIFHQLRLLKEHGARTIVLCVGYLGEKIVEAVGDGHYFGLRVSYSEDGPALVGTAGAIRKALPLLDNDFMVLYGDTFLRIDYQDVWAAYCRSKLPALMCVYRNEGEFDTSNASYSEGLVTEYMKYKPRSDMSWVDYGLSVLSSSLLSEYQADSDLATIYEDLARQRKLAGYVASERFYEIGRPESIAETAEFLTSYLS